MNEALVLILLASLTVNVLAIWRMTAATTASALQSRRIEELTEAVEHLTSRQHRLREYATSTHFHHDVMERSLRHHLHASGLIHADRIRDSYSALARARWPFDQKNWPYYLPTLHRATGQDAETKRRYEQWRIQTAGQAYQQNPGQCVDDAYIESLERSITARTESAKEADPRH